jgi:hypothetical protein
MNEVKETTYKTD